MRQADRVRSDPKLRKEIKRSFREKSSKKQILKKTKNARVRIIVNSPEKQFLNKRKASVNLNQLQVPSIPQKVPSSA